MWKKVDFLTTIMTNITYKLNSSMTQTAVTVKNNYPA